MAQLVVPGGGGRSGWAPVLPPLPDITHRCDVRLAVRPGDQYVVLKMEGQSSRARSHARAAKAAQL